jgi:ABC-2 type transport system ATP-binding protein
MTVTDGTAFGAGPAPAPFPAIRAAGLTKLYGTSAALSGLTFEVGPGEVFGFIGPNGAGKTTTLRILAGLTRPTSGHAEVDGTDVEKGGAEVRRLVGYMPDFFGVYGSMTVAEYLGFYASCYRVSRRLAARVVGDLLSLVDLEAKRDAEVDGLSRGMKQRLCLARALVHDPKVLLLDEPASGLDPRARAGMHDLVHALREMGKTVVLSSHILPELAEMCTSFGILHEGRMVLSGPAQPLLSGLGRARARAKVRGDLEEAVRSASGIEGVVAVRPGAAGTLELEHSFPDAAELLRALVGAGVAVHDFREHDIELEQLFLQLTAPCPESGEAGP